MYNVKRRVNNSAIPQIMSDALNFVVQCCVTTVFSTKYNTSDVTKDQIFNDVGGGKSFLVHILSN